MANNSEFIDEDELYDKILELFSEEKKNPNLRDLLKTRSIIELMKRLNKKKNKELAKNAIIVLISLFDDYPPDIFGNIGVDIESLTDEERETAISKLKEIFLEDED
jgi:hypothetical protein